MEKTSYYNNDICIVGIGCVLPDANNPREFWANILKGNCLIEKMPEERFKSNLYLSKNKREKDKAYSNSAAFIKNSQLEKLCKDVNLDFSKNNRLQIMSSEAVRQALSCLNADSSKKTIEASVFLGCMGINEDFVLEKFFSSNSEALKEYIEKNDFKDKKRIFEAIKKHFNGEDKIDEKAKIASALSNSIINFLKKKFNIKGEGALIDAACASSLAAIDVSVNALKNYKTDFAITGGIESNLRPDTFISFSKVGALSNGKCLPFDKKTDGLSQGEGAVIFILQRMKDALKDKNKIYGVIKSIGGSSDGKSSSLFSPSLNGQILAYKKAYENLDKNDVDYIECHGTGTKIGDSMEIKSLNKFFNGKKIPIGSVKSLIGHTKSAAGAAGLLKCILAMENKIIPPSKHIKSPIAPRGNGVYTNKKPVRILKKEKPLRFGISSFGFGNINYHIVLDEFKNGAEIIQSEKEEKITDKNIIAIIGSGSARYSKINLKSLSEKFKILPQSLASIDKMQLLALVATDNAFKKSNIKIESLNKNKVSVISASLLGLNSAFNFIDRIIIFEFKDALDFLDKKSLNLMMAYKNRFPEITEDTGPGVLNNVVAGRVCNVFDFKGENFNVDSDFNSFPAALNIATRELQEHEGVIILISCAEKLDKTKTRIKRGKVFCFLLSTLALAKKENYPIYKLIKKIKYHE